MMNDIAILCKDVRFCRMLALELGTLGYSIVCNPRGGSFRLWIADLDTVTLSVNHPERVYLGISRTTLSSEENHGSECLKLFRRPFPSISFARRSQHFSRPINPLLALSSQPPRIFSAPHWGMSWMANRFP